LSKKGAVKMSKEVLTNWKKELNTEELESYVEQNVDTIWSKYDSSEKSTGNLDFEQCQKFFADLV